ncbi:hypothetical protein Rhopal_005974-T1 [Rhodotorula paludigena]|uniref:Glycosyl transferase CAP10 domain-containing protein n=1 Tax=Rhodotorula paludigena TaxID=86838 RepID=A0AAV5GKT2_9BASI|nr:hypothetical protein Rhopal_005974-T1 [Rhodotorula paludigena]
MAFGDSVKRKLSDAEALGGPGGPGEALPGPLNGASYGGGVRRGGLARLRHVPRQASSLVLRMSWTNRLVLVTLVLLGIKLLPLPFTAPIPVPHPVPALLARAAQTHAQRRANEPQTLEQAVERYRARHDGRRPPKGFDAWYHFAVRRGACRIDGFEGLYDALRVWWGVEGAEIRQRMDRMGGEESSALGRVRVRDGRLVGWDEMRQEGVGTGARDMENQYARVAWSEMLQGLIDEGVRLPDVDFFVNQLDEPRVVLPYEERVALEARGRRRRPRPVQLDEFVLHELNAPNAPAAYDVIRQTCPPGSAARRAPLSPLPGANPHISQRYTSRFTTPVSRGAFLFDPELERTSWCDQPDLQELHQTLSRPLSFSWTDGLWPVFSNSKIDGFADILVPAWYQWLDKMPYEEGKDVEWKGKANQLYWRGTNTGGRSVELNWMGWMRSRLVSKVNRLIEWGHQERVILASSDNKTMTAVLPSTALNAALVDVAFTATDHHGEDGSLEAQRTEPSFRFTSENWIPFSTNYLFKAVLDMDGTAYSGRFPSLMRSRSAVFKSRLFTQALDDTLVPWYHYVPVSVRFSELYNLLAYFFGTASVPRVAAQQGFPELSPRDLDAVRHGVAHEEELYRIAMQGREWAQKCARRDDALVYAYLVALEWARLCGDDREGDAWSLVL